MTSVTGCALIGPSPDVVFRIECREADRGIEIGAPLPVDECDGVFGTVLSRFGASHPRLGQLILIAAERLDDCTAAGRAGGVPAEFTEPPVDRCWRTSLDYASGGRVYFAARDGETREIDFYELPTR